MTRAYDLARAVVACREMSDAAAAALRHPIPEWLAHRLATIRMEADGILGLCDDMADLSTDKKKIKPK